MATNVGQAAINSVRKSSVRKLEEKVSWTKWFRIKNHHNHKTRKQTRRKIHRSKKQMFPAKNRKKKKKRILQFYRDCIFYTTDAKWSSVNRRYFFFWRKRCSLRPIVQRNSVFPANLIANSINGLTRYRICACE